MALPDLPTAQNALNNAVKSGALIRFINLGLITPLSDPFLHAAEVAKLYLKMLYGANSVSVTFTPVGTSSNFAFTVVSIS